MRRFAWLVCLLFGGCAPLLPYDLGRSHSTHVASTRAPEAGRSHHAHDEHDARPRATPEQAAHVLVLESQQIGRRTEALGVVDVHEGSGDEDQALLELREQAAALGADAVLGVEFHHGEAAGTPTHLSGMAVRYCDPFPTDYDVISSYEVEVGMEDQEQALASLRRAAPPGTDYLIHIEYVHGEGDARVRLRATAIRFRSEGSRAYRCHA